MTESLSLRVRCVSSHLTAKSGMDSSVQYLMNSGSASSPKYWLLLREVNEAFASVIFNSENKAVSFR